MFRRWLIRGSFIGLLLLLVAGWGVSTVRWLGCWYGHDTNIVGCTVDSGGVFFVWRRGWGDTDGWHALCQAQPFRVVGRGFLWKHASSTDPDRTAWLLCCMGFQYYHHADGLLSGPHGERRLVAIPFWFLIVVTGAGLGYAWKKTGPRRGARGFPVEAVGNAEF